ncbi:MAG: beta-lactamase family protein, partial [Acidobacteriia bacterium]|nr:beta-lactamase family protein [Terriglobia bacterium]
VVLLAQQKKLSLDDDIRKFLPEIPSYGKTVTIRHLLHHTSGVRDYLTLMSLAGFNFDGVTGDEEALGLIARQKALNFNPGDEHLYSNSGFFLLSIIVKRASGKTLSQFAQENIFQPLGMKHTHIHNDHTLIVPLRATAYAPKREGGFRIDMSNFEQTGDGAVMTTVEDLLLWDQNFYEPRVGGKDLLDQLQTTGLLNNGEKLTYALGLTVDSYRGLKSVSHGGAWAGYRAELIRLPEQKMSVACLCNLGTTNPSRLARQVAEVYLGDKMSPEESRQALPSAVVELTASQMDSKTGLYRNSSSGSFMRVTATQGKLRVDSFGPVSELAAVDANHFHMVGPLQAEVVFESDKGGHQRIQVLRAAGKPEVYASVSTQPKTSTRQRLSAPMVCKLALPSRSLSAPMALRSCCGRT